MTLIQLRQLQLITIFLINNYGEEEAARILRDIFLKKIIDNLPFYAYYKNDDDGKKEYIWSTNKCTMKFEKGKKVVLSSHGDKYGEDNLKHQIAVILELFTRMSNSAFHYAQENPSKNDEVLNKKADLTKIIEKAYKNLFFHVIKLDNELKRNNKQALKNRQPEKFLIDALSKQKEKEKEREESEDDDEISQKYYPLKLILDPESDYQPARFYARLRDAVLKNFSFAHGARLRGALRELEKEFSSPIKQEPEYINLSGKLFEVLDIEGAEGDIINDAFNIIHFLGDKEKNSVSLSDKQAIVCYKTVYFQVINECIEHLAEEENNNQLKKISDKISKEFETYLDVTFGASDKNNAAAVIKRQKLLFNSFKGNPDFPCINPNLYVNQPDDQQKKVEQPNLPNAEVLANFIRTPLNQYINGFARKPRRLIRWFTREARAANDETKQIQAQNMINKINDLNSEDGLPTLESLTQVMFELNKRAFGIKFEKIIKN